MDNLTNYGENAIMKHILGVEDFTITTPLLLALMATLGTESSDGTEAAGGSYARAELALDVIVSGTNVGTQVGDVTIADMPATDCQGWSIYDSDDNRWWYGLWVPKEGTAQNAGDTVTIPSHGYTSGQKVVFQSGYAPPGLSANVTYFVKNPATNTFQLSATNGGSALTMSGDSTLVQIGKVLTILSGDDFDLEDGNLTISLS